MDLMLTVLVYQPSARKSNVSGEQMLTFCFDSDCDFMSCPLLLFFLHVLYVEGTPGTLLGLSRHSKVYLNLLSFEEAAGHAPRKLSQPQNLDFLYLSMLIPPMVVIHIRPPGCCLFCALNSV